MSDIAVVHAKGIPPELPIIIDVEASGFGRGSYPIEVGFALADGSTHCALVRPESDWNHWCGEAAAMHGITRDILMQRGKPAAEIAHWLNQHLRGADVFSDAWAHDLSWLGKLFEAAEMTPLFNLRALQTLLNEWQLRCWTALRDEVVRDLCIERHRASSDARIIQATYARSLTIPQMNPDVQIGL